MAIKASPRPGCILRKRTGKLSQRGQTTYSGSWLASGGLPLASHETSWSVVPTYFLLLFFFGLGFGFGFGFGTTFATFLQSFDGTDSSNGPSSV